MREFRVLELAVYGFVCGVLAVAAGGLAAEWSGAGWRVFVLTVLVVSVAAGAVQGPVLGWLSPRSGLQDKDRGTDE